MALDLPEPAAQYLLDHHVMTLATQGVDGPWAAAVFYAPDGDDLIFLSSPNTRHCRDLALEPRCAAAIHADAQDWRTIRGIQIEGTVSELQGPERSRAQQLYGERFPFVRPGDAPAAIVLALARVHWYKLSISRLYFIDNRRGFGQRRMFEA